MTGYTTCLHDFISSSASHQPGAPWLLGVSQWHDATCSASLPFSLLNAICPPAFMVSRHTLPTVPPPKPAAKVELVCTGAQTQTELQHAWPPYQRREGSTLLWAFCLAATTKNSLPGCVCSSFFHLSSHCSLSSVGFILEIIPRGSEDIISVE